jgi:hypothetical protein
MKTIVNALSSDGYAFHVRRGQVETDLPGEGRRRID